MPTNLFAPAVLGLAWFMLLSACEPADKPLPNFEFKTELEKDSIYKSIKNLIDSDVFVYTNRDDMFVTIKNNSSYCIRELDVGIDFTNHVEGSYGGRSVPMYNIWPGTSQTVSFESLGNIIYTPDGGAAAEVFSLYIVEADYYCTNHYRFTE